MKKKRTRKRSKPLKSKTDWARVDRLTEADIDRAIAGDPDAAPIMRGTWYKYARVVPPKVPVSIRIDRDVLDWFKQGGAGYQSRMNAALRAFMDGHRKKAR